MSCAIVQNWDKNGEYRLKRQLVSNSPQLLPKYPYVIEDEWEVETGRTDKGRGDLVFTDGSGYFAIVEVKWIDLECRHRTGSTKRTSNRKKRRTVEEQAKKYADLYAALNPVGWVEAFVFTNEDEKPYLLQTNSLQELSH